MGHSIHIVDDDATTRKVLKEFLSGIGHDVQLFQLGREMVEAVEQSPPDIAIIDVNLPDISGMAVLERLRSGNENLHCIMITGEYDSNRVVTAMKQGADDFLIKPLNLEQLRLLVERAGKEIRDRLQRELVASREGSYDFSEIIGDSSAMTRAKQTTQKVASSSANTVLIRGETGTGKELFARAIHFNSDRRDEPFVEVNCSAIPSTLLESELFGHEKGAFTDAKERKIGLIERANGGTFFLDEIGDMDFQLQAKILRVLEERCIRRVGGSRKIPVDIRFIAATHKNLDQMLMEHQFREDLYFRLSVIVLELPAMRERGEDVITLAEFFISRFAREYNRDIKGLTPAAADALRNYNWPGNVRELRNTIERAVLIEAEDWVETEHLHLWRRRTADRKSEGEEKRVRIGYDFEIPEEGFSIVEFEKVLLARAMQKARYNVSRAARMLGLSRETMRYRIKKHDLNLD